MTDTEVDITLASLRGYRTGLGLDEETARRIIVEVDAEGERDPARLALLDEATRARLTKKYAASLPVLRAAAEGRRT